MMEGDQMNSLTLFSREKGREGVRSLVSMHILLTGDGEQGKWNTGEKGQISGSAASEIRLEEGFARIINKRNF